MPRFNIRNFLKTDTIRLRYTLEGKRRYHYFEGSVEGLEKLLRKFNKVHNKHLRAKYFFVSIKKPRGGFTQMSPAAWGSDTIQIWINRLKEIELKEGKLDDVRKY